MSKANVFAKAAQLLEAVEAAEQKAAALKAEVKTEDARFKALCARKKAAVEEAKQLNDELDALMAENKALFAALKRN